MTRDNDWRKKAAELLAAPTPKKRNLSSAAGKVDDQFEAVYAARQRRKAWKDIAIALEKGEPIKVDAVESAFMRICKERGVTPPGKALPAGRQNDQSDLPSSATSDDPAAQESTPSNEITLAEAIILDAPPENGEETGLAQSNLFNDEARWVDDGE